MDIDKDPETIDQPRIKRVKVTGMLRDSRLTARRDDPETRRDSRSIDLADETEGFWSE
jgi:hypothetical protein